MDRKVQVMDERSGVPFSTLRSGTYHFNDLYGNVRAEVWKPEQSRTFSHKELVFPTGPSVRQEAALTLSRKNMRPPPAPYAMGPEMQMKGVLRHGAAARHHSENLKTAVINHDRMHKYGTTNPDFHAAPGTVGNMQVVGNL
jgi:hypothetical protein